MRNQKGKLCLILDGYLYYKTRHWKNSQFWLCADYFKTSRCKMSCSVQGDKIIRKKQGGHFHDPHTDRIAKLYCFHNK